GLPIGAAVMLDDRHALDQLVERGVGRGGPRRAGHRGEQEQQRESRLSSPVHGSSPSCAPSERPGPSEHTPHRRTSVVMELPHSAPHGVRAPPTGFTPPLTQSASRKKALAASAGLKLQWPYRL